MSNSGCWDADPRSPADAIRDVNMTWRDEYRSKLMSAHEALRAVQSANRVWIQSGCGTPSVLVDALVSARPKCATLKSFT